MVCADEKKHLYEVYHLLKASEDLKRDGLKAEMIYLVNRAFHSFQSNLAPLFILHDMWKSLESVSKKFDEFDDCFLPEGFKQIHERFIRLKRKPVITSSLGEIKQLAEDLRSSMDVEEKKKEEREKWCDDDTQSLVARVAYAEMGESLDGFLCAVDGEPVGEWLEKLLPMTTEDHRIKYLDILSQID